MEAQVQAPASLLCDPGLPASAKLVWLVARLCPDGTDPTPAWLAARSGLALPTIRRALGQLRATDWITRPTAPGPTVPIPSTLLTDRSLSIHARILYGVLLLTPGFAHPIGRCTHAGLAALAHASPNTIARALSELARAEWIKPERANRLAQIRFELTFPGFARAMRAMDRAQDRLEKPGPFGEKLMREYLTLLVDSDNFQDNVYPGFLVNPRTQERLQFDRFYPPDVAFEFNGPHHYHATDAISHEESVAQQERDLIKKGICLTRQIALVIIHDEDLTVASMRQKIGSRLPLRDLTGFDLLLDYLELGSRRYWKNLARRW